MVQTEPGQEDPTGNRLDQTKLHLAKIEMHQIKAHSAFPLKGNANRKRKFNSSQSTNRWSKHLLPSHLVLAHSQRLQQADSIS